MKFSETEGTDININSKHTAQLSGLILMLLLLSVQTSFASDLNMYSKQGELLAITDLGGNENLFFSAVMDDGVIEAIQTHPFSFNEKSNSDGTGKSNSDGTGGKSNSDGTGGSADDSNSDGTGGGDESNSDGTGGTDILLSIIMDCGDKNKNQAFGLIETESGSQTVEFDNVYLDGELMTCDSDIDITDKS